MKTHKLLFIKQIFLSFLFYSATQLGFSQTQNNKGRIGITIPVVYNYSAGVYYQTGNRKMPRGSAFSYGVNLNYIQPVYKSIFVKAGIGYLKQSFGIERPVHYRDTLKLNYFTQSYNYGTFNWLLGVGINKPLNNKTELTGSINYSGYHTFSQKYIIHRQLHTWQINKRSFYLGEMFSLEAGINRHVSKRIIAGCQVIFPVFCDWKDDPMFINTYYSSDQIKIAKNKFSAGLSISAYYHF